MIDAFEFTAQDLPHDYHSPVSMTYSELMESGFIDWDAPEWKWDAYDEDQRRRLQGKIAARYEFRSIGILPAARWRRQLIRKLNEVMPKYKLMYAKVSDGFNPFVTEDEYGKGRSVFSDFPATLLNGDEDYASNANDHEHETVREGDTLEKMDQIAKRYNDVDVLVLDELEPLFSALMTVNFNGF